MENQGVFVMVVGPSGAGKDSLIAGAVAALKNDAHFMFPRRVITRHAVTDLEDHDSVSGAEFEARRRRGAYALSWEAHGLHYGIPASIDAALVAGRVVVVNVSRQVIAGAMQKYPHCRVISIDAATELRAARLTARGRETESEVAQRLAREVPQQVGAATVIDNSGTREAGIEAFVAALRQIARIEPNGLLTR